MLDILALISDIDIIIHVCYLWISLRKKSEEVISIFVSVCFVSQYYFYTCVNRLNFYF